MSFLLQRSGGDYRLLFAVGASVMVLALVLNQATAFIKEKPDAP